MDQLKAIRYFVKVAETGSFTQAAKAFGVPSSSLSRRVADLEASLGATLLKRSTRMVKLTEIGQEYLQRTQRILKQLDQSDELVKNYQSKPAGRLTLSVMPSFGEQMLLPLVDKFKAENPDIVLDIHLSDQVTDLVRDDVDLAIRGGFAPNERLVAVKLSENQFVPAASQTYLDRYGTPEHPGQLVNHRGLFYRSPAGRLPWFAEIDGQWQEVKAKIELITNAGVWLVEKAIAGQGIVLLPQWALQPYFDQGDLVPLKFNPPLRVSQSPTFGVFLLYQKHRYAVPKIKVAVDFLVANLRDPSLT